MQHLFVLSNSRLLLSLFHEEAGEDNSINSPFPISKWLHNILTLIDRFILYFLNMFKFVFLIRKISGIPINQQGIILIIRGTMASQDTDTFARPSKRCESGQFIHSSTAIKLQWLAWSTWIQRSLKSIMIYQLAKLLMNRRLVQERYMAKKREEKMPTCTIKEITDD